MIPCITRWPDLTDDFIEVLEEGHSKDGRWDHVQGPMVLRLHGALTLAISPCEQGLALHDAVLRSDGEGRMRWRQAGLLGFLLPAPQDLETRQEIRGFGRLSSTHTVIVAPKACNVADRLGVLRRAFSLALGPEAQARVAAFRALGQARLMMEGATSGVLKPLANTPRIVVHKPDGTTSTQSLFPQASAKGRPLPDTRALLHGGACRQVLSEPVGEARCTFVSCEEMVINAPLEASHHARLAVAREAVDRFAALGQDVSPWLFRRGR